MYSIARFRSTDTDCASPVWAFQMSATSKPCITRSEDMQSDTWYGEHLSSSASCSDTDQVRLSSSWNGKYFFRSSSGDIFGAEVEAVIIFVCFASIGVVRLLSVAES